LRKKKKNSVRRQELKNQTKETNTMEEVNWGKIDKLYVEVQKNDPAHFTNSIAENTTSGNTHISTDRTLEPNMSLSKVTDANHIQLPNVVEEQKLVHVPMQAKI
jgi:hypothetical protein